eukprot:870095-Amorphochlora_amoeboformis.AAC.1
MTYLTPIEGNPTSETDPRCSPCPVCGPKRLSSGRGLPMRRSGLPTGGEAVTGGGLHRDSFVVGL